MPDAIADAALDAVIESGFGASGTQRFMGPCVAVFVGNSFQWCNFYFKFNQLFSTFYKFLYLIHLSFV